MSHLIFCFCFLKSSSSIQESINTYRARNSLILQGKRNKPPTTKLHENPSNRLRVTMQSTDTYSSHFFHRDLNIVTLNKIFLIVILSLKVWHRSWGRLDLQLVFRSLLDFWYRIGYISEIWQERSLSSVNPCPAYTCTQTVYVSCGL